VIMKKGISNVLATILILLLVIAAIGAIYKIVTPIIKESSIIQTDTLTTDLEIRQSVLVNYGENYTLGVPVKRGFGDGNVTGIEFTFSNGTDNYIHQEQTDIQEGETKVFYIVIFKKDLINPEFVSAAFIVEVKEKEFISEIKDTQEIIEEDFVYLETGESCPADADGDGFVGGEDYNKILINLGQNVEPYTSGDLDGDGFVGGGDLSLVMTYWGQECYSEPYMQAVWSSSLDILADGAFDESKNSAYLSVVQKDGDYALKAEGQAGIHRFERVVKKYFDIPSSSWGGQIYVNLHNIVHQETNDLAFVGAYDEYGPPRNFAIVSHYEYPFIWEKPVGGYIYMRAFHDNDQPITFASEEDVENMFKIPDFEVENGGVWPDRWIKIEWFLTEDERLFARVDGELKELGVGNRERIEFTQFWTGWVSSYNGGHILIKDVTLYDSTQKPDWVPV